MITYFIQHGPFKPYDLRPIKIGKALGIQHRLRATRDFPEGLELIAYIPGDVEKTVHQMFRSSRLYQKRGRASGPREWFKPTADLLEYMAERCTISTGKRNKCLIALRNLREPDFEKFDAPFLGTRVIDLVLGIVFSISPSKYNERQKIKRRLRHGIGPDSYLNRRVEGWEPEKLRHQFGKRNLFPPAGK